MTDDRKWAVEKILGHILVSPNQTLFRVKWANHPPHPDYTEPLENLVNAPILVKKFITSSLKDKKRKNRCNHKGDIFPRPNAAVTRSLRTGGDFVPVGSEKVKKIYMEVVTNTNERFYLVKFFFNDKRLLIRRAVMEYFFPLDCLIFMKKRMNRAEKASHSY